MSVRLVCRANITDHSIKKLRIQFTNLITLFVWFLFTSVIILRSFDITVIDAHIGKTACCQKIVNTQGSAMDLKFSSESVKVDFVILYTPNTNASSSKIGYRLILSIKFINLIFHIHRETDRLIRRVNVSPLSVDGDGREDRHRTSGLEISIKLRLHFILSRHHRYRVRCTDKGTRYSEK